MDRDDGGDGARSGGVVFAPEGVEEHFLRGVDPVLGVGLVLILGGGGDGGGGVGLRGRVWGGGLR